MEASANLTGRDSQSATNASIDWILPCILFWKMTAAGMTDDDESVLEESTMQQNKEEIIIKKNEKTIESFSTIIN